MTTNTPTIKERIDRLVKTLRDANQRAESWRQDCGRYTQECSDAHTALDAWRATAREVVEALADVVAKHEGNPTRSPDPIGHSHALLARPEVQRWAGR